jgi:hypothetical protein
MLFAVLLGVAALCVLPAEAQAASKRGHAIGALKDRIEAYQGTSQEGSGIRRAAPRVVIRETIRGFYGTQTEGTGIRRAAPRTVIREMIRGFVGSSQEGTGI